MSSSIKWRNEQYLCQWANGEIHWNNACKHLVQGYSLLFQGLKYDPRISKHQWWVCPYFFRLKTLEGKALTKKQKRTTQAKCPWNGREEWMSVQVFGKEEADFLMEERLQALLGNEQWQNYVGWRPNWTKYHLVDSNPAPQFLEMGEGEIHPTSSTHREALTTEALGSSLPRDRHYLSPQGKQEAHCWDPAWQDCQ